MRFANLKLFKPTFACHCCHPANRGAGGAAAVASMPARDQPVELGVDAGPLVDPEMKGGAAPAELAAAQLGPST